MEARASWPGGFAPRLFDPLSADHLPPDGISPQMRLSQLFEEWFVPIVLRSQDRSESTIGEYRTSIGWWSRLTGDPPIDGTTIYTLAHFSEQLHRATFARGKFSPPQALSKSTVRKHLKQVRAVLYRAGPDIDPKRPTADLLPKHLHIAVKKVRTRQKPPFEVDVAQSLVDATATMRRSRRMPCPVIRCWFPALLFVLFYTGLRIGTVLQLRHRMIEWRNGQPWLSIPGEIVDKTEKPLEKFLHPMAWQSIERLRGVAGGNEDLIFPWPHHRKNLWDRHRRLQLAAGVSAADCMGLHAWRRTHARQMGLLGAKLGLKVAQLALDHADDRVTSESYLDLEADLIRKLPVLEPPAGERQQLLF